MPTQTKLSGARLHDGDTPTANTPNAALNVYRHNKGHSDGHISVPVRLENGRMVCCGRGEMGSPRFLKKTSEPFEECSVEIQARYLSTPM